MGRLRSRPSRPTAGCEHRGAAADNGILPGGLHALGCCGAHRNPRRSSRRVRAPLRLVALSCAHRPSGAGTPPRDAEREAEAIRREAQVDAREQSVQLRSEIEAEVQDRRVQIAKVEERVVQKEAEVEARLTDVERKEQGLGDREVHVKALQDELRESQKEALGALERISGLTVHEARQQLLERSKDLIRHELARDVRQMEEEARADARRRARALIADSLQRVAASHTAEATVSVVELASDDLKGRIIGREGATSARSST